MQGRAVSRYAALASQVNRSGSPTDESMQSTPGRKKQVDFGHFASGKDNFTGVKEFEVISPEFCGYNIIKRPPIGAMTRRWEG
jgi:hypothetical protein